MVTCGSKLNYLKKKVFFLESSLFVHLVFICLAVSAPGAVHQAITHGADLHSSYFMELVKVQEIIFFVVGL